MIRITDWGVSATRPSRLAGLLALASLLTGCSSLTRQILYSPGRPPTKIDASVSSPSMVTARTNDGLALKGYFWPGGADDPDVIIFFHGRNWTAGRGAETARPLADGQNSLLVASYRGFDDNPGKPTEEGLVADAHAFIRLAIELAGPDARIWLIGHSLGAAVALHAASSDTHVRGVFLLSAFARVTDAVPRMAQSLVPDAWDNLAAMSYWSGPVIIVQGGLDRFIPTSSGDELFSARRGPASLIVGPESRHNPDMKRLSPWLNEAIANMEHGSLTNLPSPPPGWIEKVRQP